jgi:hypothetical protein
VPGHVVDNPVLRNPPLDPAVAVDVEVSCYVRRMGPQPKRSACRPSRFLERGKLCAVQHDGGDVVKVPSREPTGNQEGTVDDSDRYACHAGGKT